MSNSAKKAMVPNALARGMPEVSKSKCPDNVMPNDVVI